MQAVEEFRPTEIAEAIDIQKPKQACRKTDNTNLFDLSIYRYSPSG